MKLLLFLILFFPACTIHPFAYNPNTGEMTSLGASALTKSTNEGAYAYTPTGQPMGYYIQGKDETYLPKAYFWERGITSVAGTSLDGYRTSQSTRRILGGQSVEKLGIRAARDVRLAEIAVPPVVP